MPSELLRKGRRLSLRLAACDILSQRNDGASQTLRKASCPLPTAATLSIEIRSHGYHFRNAFCGMAQIGRQMSPRGQDLQIHFRSRERNSTFNESTDFAVRTRRRSFLGTCRRSGRGVHLTLSVCTGHTVSCPQDRGALSGLFARHQAHTVFYPCPVFVRPLDQYISLE
jgi:hypothetical protein